MVPRRLIDNDKIKTGTVLFKFLEKGSLESISSQQVFDKASKDALTGAYNKGALLDKGPESIKRAQVLSEPLSVITYDIDFFKKINAGGASSAARSFPLNVSLATILVFSAESDIHLL